MIIKKQKVKKKLGGGGGGGCKILRTLNLKNAFIDFFLKRRQSKDNGLNCYHTRGF